jgi:hypothetical protein
MGTSISIIVGAIVIAAAILVTNHWEIVSTSGGLLVVDRLNRWTGSIEICAVDPNTIHGSEVAGARLSCDSPK